MPRKQLQTDIHIAAARAYDAALEEISDLLESVRHAAARSVNLIMTATYWQIGRRIVELEQSGHSRAAYGTRLVERLSADLIKQFGRGFGVANLTQMRKFYQIWPQPEIVQTVSEEFGMKGLPRALRRFSLSWSHYVRLLSVAKAEARRFSEAGAPRGAGRFVSSIARSARSSMSGHYSHEERRRCSERVRSPVPKMPLRPRRR